MCSLLLLTDAAPLPTGLLSWFVPCYQFGKNAEAVGENCCLCGFLLCFLYWWGGPLWVSILRCTIRGKIRQQKGIDVSVYEMFSFPVKMLGMCTSGYLQGSAIGDCCCNYWCDFCTLAQESQEVQGVGGQSMARE